MAIRGVNLAVSFLKRYEQKIQKSAKAGVIEAATPTAVLSTVLSTEFDTEPAFVTSVVFTTTLLSPLTLTPLLAYLGA